MPQVGFPHSEPVIIETNVKIMPAGAKLLAIKGINLILKIILKIDATPINAKHPSERKDDGT